MGIVDVARVLVVEYKYDAWGKLPSTTGTLADTLGKRNPFRYRKYIYDPETGMYDLYERYYSPDLKRFLVRDMLILPNNLSYAYCNNLPSSAVDVNGYFTVAFGYNVGLANVVRFGFCQQVVIDSSGNFGAATTYSLGVGTPDLSIGGNVAVSQAETIEDMNGFGVQASIAAFGVNLSGSYSGSGWGGTLGYSKAPKLLGNLGASAEATYTKAKVWVEAPQADPVQTYNLMVRFIRENIIALDKLDVANGLIQACTNYAKATGQLIQEILIPCY